MLCHYRENLLHSILGYYIPNLNIIGQKITKI